MCPIKIWHRRFFTLLELMIGIAILGLASSAIAWKMSRAVERKRFSSNLDCLKSRLIDSRHLAMNMQADWKGVLHQERGVWIFETQCLNGMKRKKRKTPSPLNLGTFSVMWNGEKKEKLEFLFTANGVVLVGEDSSATFTFSKKDMHCEWKIPALFAQEESRDGKKLGPLHPAEI